MKFKDSYWLRSGTYSLLQQVAVLVFGFGGVFFLLRSLTRDDFGTWALFLTVAAVIEVARNGLIQNALIKHLASADDADHHDISTASLVINIGLTLLSMLLLACLAGPLSRLWSAPELEAMFYIYAGTTFLLIPFSQFNFVQQAYMEFKGIFWSTFVRSGILFFYIFISFVSGFEITLYRLVVWQLVAAFWGSVTAYFFTKEYLAFSKVIKRKWVIELLNYGKYVFGTNLSAMLYRNIDKMMLGSLLSTVSVAVYDLAIRITNLIEVPTGAMTAIVFPKSAKKSAEEGLSAAKYLYERSVAVILCAIVPGIIIVYIFAEPIILIIAGDKYSDTAPILRLTLLYGLVIPFLRQFGTALDSVGKPKINFYFVIITTILNVTFNYIFINQFGIIGAVYGTLAAFSIMMVLNHIVLHKILGINFLNVFVYMGDTYKQLFNQIRKLLSKKAPSEL